MASGLLHYFNFGASAPKEAVPQKESPVRALPASWYTSQAMYEIERRAIFSKRWLFMTHTTRVKNTGDWLRYTVAGYDIIITKDRSGKVNAFHNVCRHRAYPVIEKEGSGNAKILACRYHGWSYGLNGTLAKAPGYQELEFDKAQNSLFPIHTRIDRNGFIWINMDAAETPEVPFEEHFEDVDVQQRYTDSNINFDDYDLHHTYDLEGHYNWKILSDNFNECYHCPTTHPDIPAFLNLESFDSHLKDGHIQHACEPTEEQVKAGVNTHSTYYFPNSSMSVSRHFIMIQKFMPITPNTSKMSYEIYKNKNSTDEDFHLIADMYERVMREDKVLCDAAQKNLDRGVFVNGQLHPKYEKAPLFFQNTVRQVITEHYEKEKKAGKEIWPAKQTMKENAKTSDDDEAICAGIECGTGGQQKEVLAW
ncbi:putative Rieske 2Fe-2S family protein [Ophiobolus disseminans]|uniref:Choline monooxygenase, chloroplastic n=1 Tax=Ophiobolus disseminans TaxID=1469910 RepID=A0A6A6ZF45_9PLEO|nr:putative Rieske 2Fe-2S family protein [Ophiobolus disseminans]